MKRMSKTAIGVAVALGLSLTTGYALAHGGQACGGACSYHSMMGQGMSPGMMGQGMGPGRMGQGMGPDRMGQGMGPGMMGQGMGHGMMGQGMGPDRMGQGMGPGMMGQGMGPGMMGQGMGHGMMGQGMGPGMMGQGMDPGTMGEGMGPCANVGEVTVESVRAGLEERLARTGNPRLKVGRVEAEGENAIIAEVVTVDDSLVNRFEIDRKTGRWHPKN